MKYKNKTVFPQDRGKPLTLTMYKEVIDSVLSVRKCRPPAADYQPPSGKFSGSPHHIGSAPSSPSPLLWLYESPVSGTKVLYALLKTHHTRKQKSPEWWMNCPRTDGNWRLTLIACPKKPFPKISPWMRSHGRKMR